VLASQSIEMSTRIVIARVVRISALFIAVLVALPLVGLDVTTLSIFSGALGVGLGFGLQKIASNYVSGFIVLLDRSLRIGDVVTVDGRKGEVKAIETRYTVIKGLDGVESIIPNEFLITQSVSHHTYSDPKVAVVVPLTVAYESDLDLACELLLRAAAEHKRVIADPAAGSRVKNLADSGVELELTVWIADPSVGEGVLRSDLLKSVVRLFREHVGIAPLVDDGERRAEPVGPALTDPDPPGVGRYHGHVAHVQLGFQVAREDRQREQVVHRPVEEALDLRGVQIDGHQPVGARGREQVRDEPRRDRLPATALLVLPGVAEERHNHGDPLGRRPLERVDHDELLHDPLVDRRGVALQHEGVATADRLQEPNHDLAVGEVVQLRGRRLDPHAVGDLGGKLGKGPPAEQHHLLLAGRRHATHLVLHSLRPYDRNTIIEIYPNGSVSLPPLTVSLAGCEAPNHRNCAGVPWLSPGRRLARPPGSPTRRPCRRRRQS